MSAARAESSPGAGGQSPGNPFKFWVLFCCAIEPWGHAASLATGPDVTPRPARRPHGGSLLDPLGPRPVTPAACPATCWEVGMGEGTISELGGREKLHLEMLWGQCECDAGETYQLGVVTPWVRIPLARAQPGVRPQVSPASCEERTKHVCDLWVSGHQPGGRGAPCSHRASPPSF